MAEGAVKGFQETKDFLQRQEEGSLKIQEEALKLKSAQQTLQRHEQAIRMAQSQLSQMGAGGTPMDELATMRTYASAEMAAGNFEAGAELMDKATKAEKDSAEARTANANRMIQSLEHISSAFEAANFVDESVPNSQQINQQRLSRFWMGYMQMHPEVLRDPSPSQQVLKMMQMPYSPRMRETIYDAANTAKERAEIEKNKATAQAEAARAKEAEYKTKDYWPAKTREADATAKYRAKHGGRGAGGVTYLQAKDDIKIQIQRDFKGMDPHKADDLARKGAQYMLDLMEDEDSPHDREDARALTYQWLKDQNPKSFYGERPTRQKPGVDEQHPVAAASQEDVTKPDTWYKLPDGKVIHTSKDFKP